MNSQEETGRGVGRCDLDRCDSVWDLESFPWMALFPTVSVGSQSGPPSFSFQGWAAWIFRRFSDNVVHGMEILVLLTTGWWGILRGNLKPPGEWMALSVGVLGHFLFARTGVMLSYEAYLVSLFLIVLWKIRERVTDRSIRGLLLLAFLPLVPRSVALFQVPAMHQGVYCMTYLPFVWLHPTDTVATTVPSMPVWMGIPTVDLYGVADQTVGNWLREGMYERLAVPYAQEKGACLLVLPARVSLELSGATLLGKWVVPSPAFQPDREVFFYSLCPERNETYASRLWAVQAILPEDVKWIEGSSD